MCTYPCFSQKEPPKIPWLYLLAVLVMTLLMCLIFSQVKAEEINLDIIAKIESNNNPLAYNKMTGAAGMYQFLPIAWKDVQENFPELKKYPFFCARKPQVARLFADKYLNIRIPQLLLAFKLEDTVNNKLIAYNAGIGKLSKGIIPQESLNYVKKYHKLLQSYGR